MTRCRLSRKRFNEKDASDTLRLRQILGSSRQSSRRVTAAEHAARLADHRRARVGGQMRRGRRRHRAATASVAARTRAHAGHEFQSLNEIKTKLRPPRVVQPSCNSQERRMLDVALAFRKTRGRRLDNRQGDHAYTGRQVSYRRRRPLRSKYAQRTNANATSLIRPPAYAPFYTKRRLEEKT